jgi:hypothetical protein
MQARNRRPSPALIISIIALITALSGSAYAALKLPKNSVGTKQVRRNAITTAKIRKNAVTGAKVKAASLTGADINATTLGTVPSANTANSLAAAEPLHLVGASGEPPFLSGSSTFPSPGGGLKLAPVGFYKDRAGIVHLEGVAKTGKGTPVVGVIPIFILPPGFRPDSGTIHIFGGGTSAAAVFGSNVTVEGKVLGGMVGGEEGEATALDGITFRAGS